MADRLMHKCSFIVERENVIITFMTQIVLAFLIGMVVGAFLLGAFIVVSALLAYKNQ